MYGKERDIAMQAGRVEPGAKSDRPSIIGLINNARSQATDLHKQLIELNGSLYPILEQRPEKGGWRGNG